MRPMPVRKCRKADEKARTGGLRREVQECSHPRGAPWPLQDLNWEIAAGAVRGDDPAANLFQDDLTRPLLEGMPRAKAHATAGTVQFSRIMDFVWDRDGGAATGRTGKLGMGAESRQRALPCGAVHCLSFCRNLNGSSIATGAGGGSRSCHEAVGQDPWGGFSSPNG
jgi:hypothetical protein